MKDSCNMNFERRYSVWVIWQQFSSVLHLTLMTICNLQSSFEILHIQWLCMLTHWGRVTQICVFTLQLRKTTQICVFNTRLFSLHNTLNYAIHGACLQMVLLTNVYRNLTSLWIKPRERVFKQFKSPVLNVLKFNHDCKQVISYYAFCIIFLGTFASIM